LHIAEEYWCGERFFNWASRVAGINMTEDAFLGINQFAWIVMFLGCVVATLAPEMRWLVVAFASAVSLNGVAHLLASIFTWSYSPGVVTGLLLWIPLGVFTLVRARGRVSRVGYLVGILLGFGLHTLVTLTAYSMSPID
jgi:hypothetical protein